MKDNIFSKETESPESLLRLEASVIQGLISQSCLTLCDPIYCSPAGSSLRGISPARILEWVAVSSSRRFSQLRDQTLVSCVSSFGRRILCR